jgi:hypothetical protein
MGTITRTFANNITTSGVFKPTAFNDASFDNVTAVPSGAVEGGNMVLLSTQTASGDASISFTSGITSTYKEYMFIFNNIHPASNSNLQFQTSTDGGSSYGVTATTTFFYASHQENDGEAILAYLTSRDQAQSTDFIYLTGDNMEASASDASVSGYLHLFEPSSTTFVKHYMSNTDHVADGPYQQNNYSAGYFNTTSAINAVQFKMSSGNIDAGTIQMFGIL